jgi:transcriptional regulator with XRE-family HTH domain
MSFQITLTPSRRSASRFIGQVRRSLQKALADRPDLTQSDLATELGVNRSVISRQMRGAKDMSLGRVAEIATILGYEPDFVLHPIAAAPGQNVPAQLAQAPTVTKTAATTAATASFVVPRIPVAA